MSKVKKVIKNVGQSLGLIPTHKQLEAQIPKIPDPVIPAPPAATVRNDTGAQVVVGTSAATKDQRVSGRGSRSGNGSAGNPLGGLGRGGLSL